MKIVEAGALDGLRPEHRDVDLYPHEMNWEVMRGFVDGKVVASDASGLIESTAELGAGSGSLHIVR